ncbi:MAG: transaldolase [Thermoanaerobaculia bacterium]
MTNPLKRLCELGQSVWYDYIRRDLYAGGELRRLIEEDGLRGMTSNPTIFQKGIAETDLYDEDMKTASREGLEGPAIFERLAVTDVQRAADLFRPVYEESRGADGFVSIEVSPGVALDTEASIAEARHLWKACARPNVMVKIPGTREGVPAIRRCLAEGININITLLFSVERHREVMEAYLSAMEERARAGEPLDSVRSVASFFVSRVDTNIDAKLDSIAKEAKDTRRRDLARQLRGKVATANARIAYQAFREVFGGSRFDALRGKGARLQRPLWASTSTKDPAYPPLYYVEALIGPDTVDTMPPDTFEEYRRSGDPKVRIGDDLEAAHAAFRQLEEVGVDEKQVYRELEEEGVRKFSDSFRSLIGALEEKEKAMRVA